jgi:serine/threonine protein kinase
MAYVTRRFAAGELIAQKYLLLNLLGRGASGVVFRARNIVAGNVLALKLLIDQTDSDSEEVKRFFRQARAINRIGHPNIVSVFDAGYAEAIPYIAMEYLSGESLAQVLDRGPRLPFAAASAIMLKVLDALAAAHRATIVHRDLKPANVFLHRLPGTSLPTVKLLDFGVAKIRDESESSVRTESGMILGTPDFLSPEQITGENEVDGRADLFAAGALTFELLTGRAPFHGPTIVATTYRIVHEATPTLAQAGGPDDPELEKVLARALCKRPDDRYPSAAEFARALEAISPEPCEREAALRELGVGLPAADDAGLFAVPRTSQAEVETVRNQPRSEASGHLPAAPKITARAPNPQGDTTRRKLSRSWAELPIVGRRRANPAPTGNVRGAALLAINRALATRYGGDVREDIIGAMPREAHSLFRGGAPSPDTWYPLAHLAAYLASANQIAVHDDADRWRALGYAGVETDLLTLLRSVRSQSDGYAALRVSLPVLAGLFDFGEWSLESTQDSLRVEASGFFRTPLSLHDWLAGVVEHAVRSTGQPYRLTLSRPSSEAEEGPIQFVATPIG